MTEFELYTSALVDSRVTVLDDDIALKTKLETISVATFTGE